MTTPPNQPTRAALLQGIRTVLGNVLISPVTASSDLWDLYEVYVFSIVIAAARDEGAQVSFRRASLLPDVSSPAIQMLFRRAPGSLRVTTVAYTFARIEFPGKPALESHVGVYVYGKSGIFHECDVLVLPEQKAIIARRNQEEPKASDIFLMVECKFYASGLSIDLARSFLGLTVEYGKEKCYFISNTSTPAVSQVLAESDRRWQHNIVPSLQAEVDRFRGVVRDVFKNYKAGKS